MKNTNLFLTALLVIIFSGASFFAGSKYQQSQSPFNAARRVQLGGQNRQMMGRSLVNGEIIAQDDKSITVKLTDGSSKIILLSSTTSINQASPAVVSDLKVGERVAVFGQTNTDGSITAQSVELNPVQPSQPLLK